MKGQRRRVFSARWIPVLGACAAMLTLIPTPAAASVPNPACPTATSSSATSCTWASAGQFTFSVPAGVTSLQVIAVGASGGNSTSSAPSVPKPGDAAIVSATIPASGGVDLYAQVDVGGGAGDGFAGGGGGMSAVACTAPSGGEAFPGCRAHGFIAPDQLLIAGGGGGASATLGGGGGAGGGAIGGAGVCNGGSGTNGDGGAGAASFTSGGTAGQQCNAGATGGAGGTSDATFFVAGGGGGGGGAATGGAGGANFFALAPGGGGNAPAGSQSGGGGAGLNGGAAGKAGPQGVAGSSGGGGGSSWVENNASAIQLSDAKGAAPFVTIAWTAPSTGIPEAPSPLWFVGLAAPLIVVGASSRRRLSKSLSGRCCLDPPEVRT